MFPWNLLLLLLPPCHSLGEGAEWEYTAPAPARAQDRVDPGGPQIDAALLRQVLEDPVLLQAVDPQVLQMVLVQAAAANLLNIPNFLPPTTTSTTPRPRPPPPPLNLQPLLPQQSLFHTTSSSVQNLPHSLQQIQVDLPNLDPATQRPPRRTPTAPASPPQQIDEGLRLDTVSLAQALRDHPDIAAELASRLQAEPGLAADLGLLDPVRAPTTPPAPHCPVTTPEGSLCGPGLAYSALTRACEWPDTLMEAGCNPESKDRSLPPLSPPPPPQPSRVLVRVHRTPEMPTSPRPRWMPGPGPSKSPTSASAAPASAPQVSPQPGRGDGAQHLPSDGQELLHCVHSNPLRQALPPPNQLPPRSSVRPPVARGLPSTSCRAS